MTCDFTRTTTRDVETNETTSISPRPKRHHTFCATNGGALVPRHRLRCGARRWRLPARTDTTPNFWLSSATEPGAAARAAHAHASGLVLYGLLDATPRGNELHATAAALPRSLRTTQDFARRNTDDVHQASSGLAAATGVLRPDRPLRVAQSQLHAGKSGRPPPSTRGRCCISGCCRRSHRRRHSIEPSLDGADGQARGRLVAVT